MKLHFTGERFIPDDVSDSEIEIEHMQRYIFAENFVKNKIVLDVACGEGYGSNILAQTAKKVIGVDIDDETIKYARSKYSSSNISFVCSDVEKLPFEDNFFDVIVSYETIEHIDEIKQKEFLNEIDRVLKCDGLLIMSTPNKEVYTDLVNSNNKYHIKEFYFDEFKNFLNLKFSNIVFYYQFPQTVYILTNLKNPEMIFDENIKEIRYYIAVCSKKNITDCGIPYVNCKFNNNMYYYLNRQNHFLENEIITDTQKRNEYEKKLISSLDDAKEYVQHLEKDLDSVKQSCAEKDKQLEENKEYIRHLEKDIQELKNTINQIIDSENKK